MDGWKRCSQDDDSVDWWTHPPSRHARHARQHLYERFRIDSALHLDPVLLLPPDSSSQPPPPGKKKDEDDELTTFLLALKRAWGGLAHVCIVPDGGVDGVPSKSHPQVH